MTVEEGEDGIEAHRQDQNTFRDCRTHLWRSAGENLVLRRQAKLFGGITRLPTSPRLWPVHEHSNIHGYTRAPDSH
jgi:hypothetical protein